MIIILGKDLKVTGLTEKPAQFASIFRTQNCHRFNDIFCGYQRYTVHFYVTFSKLCDKRLNALFTAEANVKKMSQWNAQELSVGGFLFQALRDWPLVLRFFLQWTVKKENACSAKHTKNTASK